VCSALRELSSKLAVSGLAISVPFLDDLIECVHHVPEQLDETQPHLRRLQVAAAAEGAKLIAEHDCLITVVALQPCHELLERIDRRGHARSTAASQLV
jgi:hypothetical protein